MRRQPLLKCSCPCDRRTPKFQGVAEIERTGLRMIRCMCRDCGNSTRGCHHLVPPYIHRRYGGFCWVCATRFDQWHIPNNQAPAVVPLDDASTLAPVSGPPSSSLGATSSSPIAGPTSCPRRELYPIRPLVVRTVSGVAALAPGYLSVDSDVVIQILYIGDPEDVDQEGWVYAEIVASGRRGWLPITVLPSSFQLSSPLVTQDSES